MATTKKRTQKSKRKKTTADQPIGYIIPRKNASYNVYVHAHYRRRKD